jgi:hypothetical protein
VVIREYAAQQSMVPTSSSSHETSSSISTATASQTRAPNHAKELTPLLETSRDRNSRISRGPDIKQNENRDGLITFPYHSYGASNAQHTQPIHYGTISLPMQQPLSLAATTQSYNHHHNQMSYTARRLEEGRYIPCSYEVQNNVYVQASEEEEGSCCCVHILKMFALFCAMLGVAISMCLVVLCGYLLLVLLCTWIYSLMGMLYEWAVYLIVDPAKRLEHMLMALWEYLKEHIGATVGEWMH